MTEKLLLKDQLFNEATLRKLTSALKAVYPPLDDEKMHATIVKEMQVLELKARISLVADQLDLWLPSDYYEAINVMVASLKSLSPCQDFVFAAYSEYLERHGCVAARVDDALEVLGFFTQYFSAEFSIRKFINRFPEETYRKMLAWSKSDLVDQRRLASEGLRPKLPWACKINFDYRRGMEPLDNLFDDSETYVVRSVANHLNDVSKFDPDLVVEVLKTWRGWGRQSEKDMAYLIRHSLRTSIKAGHAMSLSFMGYAEDPKIRVDKLGIKDSYLTLGDYLDFSFDIQGHSDQALMVDYKITYPMARGKRSSKVFKLKKTSIKAGEKLGFQKKHLFKVMTTKKLYGGIYNLDIQINGHIYGSASFYLSL